MDRARYDQYLEAFHRRDYGAVADFYLDPPQLRFFGIEIGSREALRAFYGFLHDHVVETISVRNFACSPSLVAVDAIVRIQALKDLTSEALHERGFGGLQPMRSGEIIEMRQFLHYTMRHALIANVECVLAD